LKLLDVSYLSAAINYIYTTKSEEIDRNRRGNSRTRQRASSRDIHSPVGNPLCHDSVPGK